MPEKKYLLIIGQLTPSVVLAVNSVLKDKLLSELELIVIARNVDYTKRIIKRYEPNFKLRVLTSNFDKRALEQIIEPIKDKVIGINCRTDKRTQDLRKVIPLLPEAVFASSYESLTIATNKRLMREAFEKYAPSITPGHILVKDDSKESITRIEKRLGYPVIVKPTNLASSLLIQSCQNRSELKAALKKIFNIIESIYQQEERDDPPEVIVEEYLEGDFYSLDAYTLGAGDTYVCPPVSYIPAKQLGIDDFYIYKRFMPANLKESEVEEANKVTKLAIKSIGLKYTSAHVELVHTQNGWRVIELGPRLGRFRNRMYKLAYDIDHSLNDVKIHLGINPIIKTKLINYCAGYSIYPHHEGQLVKIKGLDKIIGDPDLKWHRIFAEPGQKAIFAKHGGHILAELLVADTDKQAYLNLTNLIENSVYADIV